MTMHSRDINDIVAKIDEMRAVFVLGQRAIPFLEEVFVFLRDISPLFDDINRSIRESADKMPRATSQLQSVTQATQVATTEILDLVDAVLERLEPLRAHLERTGAMADDIARCDDESEAILTDLLNRHGIELPAKLDDVWARRRAAITDLKQRCDTELEVLDDIRRRLNRIMISLQVQDITAQQLASVNHLIESIRARMSSLVDRLGATPPPSSDDSWLRSQDYAFNPDARYDRSSARQEMIDSVLDGDPQPHGKETPSESAAGESVTDAVIDQIFASCEAEPPRPAAADGDAPAGARRPASQAEVDALFNNGSAR